MLSYLGNDCIEPACPQAITEPPLRHPVSKALPLSQTRLPVDQAESQCTAKSVPLVPDKKLIKLRFEQAASTYEQHAQVQSLVAERLLNLLDRTARVAVAPRILEIGCCTGLLTEKITERYQDITHLTASDLVDAFEHCLCRKGVLRCNRVTFLAGDIETVPLAGTYDLIISSSTLQWVHNLSRLSGKLSRHVAQNGLLAVSLYGRDNMQEIRSITGMGLDYLGLDQLKAVLGEHFQIVAAEQSRETLWFPDALAVLQHLRATGVNSIGQKAWTRKQLRVFLAEYNERFSSPEGVRLTYHPMYVIARP